MKKVLIMLTVMLLVMTAFLPTAMAYPEPEPSPAVGPDEIGSESGAKQGTDVFVYTITQYTIRVVDRTLFDNGVIEPIPGAKVRFYYQGDNGALAYAETTTDADGKTATPAGRYVDPAANYAVSADGSAAGYGLFNSASTVTAANAFGTPVTVQFNAGYTANTTASGSPASYSRVLYEENAGEKILYVPIDTTETDPERIVDPNNPNDPDKDNYVTYTIAVKDANSSPLSGATVTLYDSLGNALEPNGVSGANPKTTTASGSVSWTVKKGGSYSASATLDGYTQKSNNSPVFNLTDNETRNIVLEKTDPGVPDRIVDPTDPDDPDKDNYVTYTVRVTSSSGGGAIGGATVTLLDRNGNTLGTATAGTDGTASWTVKKGGTYSALSAKDGYVEVTNSSAVSNLTANRTVGITMKTVSTTNPDRIVDPTDPGDPDQDNYVTYTVTVRDADNGNTPVSGATVLLRDRNGKTLGSKSTGNDGKAIWTVKAGGTYSAVASKEGKTQKSNTTAVQNLITNYGGLILLTEQPTPTPPDRIVDPTDPNDPDKDNYVTYTIAVKDANGNAALTGAQVNLLDRSGNVLGTKTTGTAGTASWTVKKGGTYSATATLASYTEKSNASPVSNLTANTSKTIVLQKDAPTPPDRIVDPTDPDDPDNDNYVNYTVKVTDVNGGGNLSRASVVLLDRNGNSLGVKTTGVDGIVSWTVKKSGTYAAIAAKSGYVEDSNFSAVSDIRADKTVGITMKASTTTDPDRVVDPENPTDPDKDNYVTYSVVVKDADNGNAPVSGATVLLRDRNGKTLGTSVTGSDGKVNWTVKKGGTYSASAGKDGYTEKSNTSVIAALETSYTGTILIGKQANPTDPDRIVDPTDPNDPDKDNYATYSIRVKDTSGASLGGAAVNLYDSDGKVLGTKTTGSDGLVSWTVKKGGTYSATSALTGYVESSNLSAVSGMTEDTTRTVTLKKNETSNPDRIVAPNDPSDPDRDNYVTYTVKVTNSAGGAALNGASVVLLDRNGKALGTKTAGADGTASWTVKKGGTYSALAGKDGFIEDSNTSAVSSLTADRTVGITMKSSATTDPDRIVDPTDPADPDKENYVVYYVAVRDANDGNAAMPGATVALRNRDGKVLGNKTADAAGIVSWTVKMGGTYSAAASKDGYVELSNATKIEAIASNFTGVTLLTKETSTTDPDRVVDPTNPNDPDRNNYITYTIQVKNDSGAALSGASVTIYTRTGTPLGSKTTGTDGKVSWTVKKGGSYSGTATLTGYSELLNNSAVTNLMQDATRDIQLKAPAAVLTVIVQDKATGTLLPGASVYLYDANGTLLETKAADANGQVQFNTVQGAFYSIGASMTGYVSQEPYRFQMNSSSLRATIKLTKSDSKGRLDDSEAGIAYTVFVKNTVGAVLSGATVNLYNADGDFLGTQTTTATGSVSWKVLKGYGYYATAAKEGYTTIASASQIVNATTNVTITLDSAAATYPLIVRVTNSNTEAAITGATIELYTDSGTLVNSGTGNPTLTFNVAAGTYYLKVSANGYTTYEKFSVSKTAAEQTVTVPLTPTSTTKHNLVATVVSASTGSAVSGASVKVYDAYGQLIGSGTTDSSGKLTLSLPDGTGYYAIVSGSGYNTLTSSAFSISKDTTATFKLAKEGSSSGGSSNIAAKEDGTSPKTGERCMLHWYILASIFAGVAYTVLRNSKGKRRFMWYDLLAVLIWLVGMITFAMYAECVIDGILLGVNLVIAVVLGLRARKQAGLGGRAA